MKWTSGILAAVTTAAACFGAETPAQQKAQYELQKHYKEALRTYEALSLPAMVPTQANEDAWNVRSKEFKQQLRLFRLPSVTLPLPPCVGSSLLWQPRLRLHPRPVVSAETYNIGPGNVIVPFSGEFTDSAADLALPGRGDIHFALQREYAAFSQYDCGFGQGWDFNYNAGIIIAGKDLSSAQKLTVFFGQQEIQFQKQANQEWLPEPGSFLQLQSDAQHIFLIAPDLKRYEFELAAEQKDGEQHWRLAAIASRHDQYRANRLAITYLEKCDRLQHITDPYGEKINFAYDESGHIVQIASSRGAVRYTYDADHRLSKVDYPQVQLSTFQDFTPQTSYQYTEDARHLLCRKSANTVDYSLEIGYDPHGRATSIGYAAKDQQQRWSIVYQEGKTIIRSPAPTPETHYCFANPVHPSLPSSIAIPAQKAVWRYTFNADYLLTKTVEPMGNRQEQTYDSANANILMRGNLLLQQALPAEGVPAHLKMVGRRFQYDARIAAPTRMEQYQITAEGKEEILQTETTAYSETDLMPIAHSTNGIEIQTRYNRYGLPVLEWDANKNVSIFCYAEKLPDAFSYDFADGSVLNGGPLVREITDATDEQIEKACSQLKIDRISRNRTLRLTVKPCAVESRTAYDPYGNVIHTQSPYQESLALVSRDGKTLAACEKGTGMTQYFYLPSGKTKSIQHEYCPADPKGFQGEFLGIFSGRCYEESFQYDSLGQMLRHQLTSETFDGKVSVFQYQRYPNGKVEKIISPLGVARHDAYDAATGQLRKQTLTGGNQSVVLSSGYEYYPNGKVKSYCDQFGGKHTVQLDGFGNAISETDPRGVVATELKDGLGRTTLQTSFCNGQELTRTEYFYHLNGKLDHTVTWQIGDGKRVPVETERYLYDAAGNVIGKRGPQKESWQYFLLDGCGNTIATRDPEGNFSAEIYRNTVSVYKQNFFRQEDRFVTTGNAVEPDFAGRPLRATPVNARGKLVPERQEIRTYDLVGQCIAVQTAGLTTTRQKFNSLGKVTEETITPTSMQYGEKPVTTSYVYRADGSMRKKTVGNQALALRGEHKDKVKAELVDAPQVTEWQYDALGRIAVMINPDGLTVTNIYNEHSLPQEKRWTHVADPEKVLRNLQFSYSPSGEVTAITDALTQKPLRQYQYDKLGNCVQAVDLNGNDPVTVVRSYNSMGQMLSEQLQYQGLFLPSSQYTYSPAEGRMAVRWEGLKAPSGKFWEQETYQYDKASHPVKLFLNKETQPFAEWTYLGPMPCSRNIPSSHITITNRFNDLLEITETNFGSTVGKLEYEYGPQGQQLYASTELQDRRKGKRYTFAAYSQFDSFRRMVGQNGEVPVPSSRKEAMTRHRQLMDGADQSVQAVNTCWMVHDQANNIWGRYMGTRLEKPLPDALTMDNSASFASPAAVIPDQFGAITELRQRELASNRETATASYTQDANLSATEHKYDHLGNLTEYEGTYWNGELRYPVTWALTYDPLGRLVHMTATATAEQGFISEGEKAGELDFVYDAENRRLVKQVHDFSRLGKRTRTELTLFRGTQQSLVFALDEGKKLDLQEQYLWGVNSRELLMSAQRSSRAENSNDYEFTRYYFQQDKGLNVIYVSKTVAGHPEPVATASYLGFGENATAAEVKEIRSSMTGDNQQYAINRKLDERIDAEWSNRGGWQYLELKLSETSKLSQLKIWTDQFPKDFWVFVLPEGAASPGGEMTSSWLAANMNMNESGRKNYNLVAQVINGQIFRRGQIKGESLASPYQIPLRERQGDRIVIAWQDCPQSSIRVREFDVNKVPDNPASIAFAGQWLDRETGMYYQVNRYRLAGSDKFISPDPIGFLDGNNLYAYAKGNPLEWHDPDGRIVTLLPRILIGAGIGAILGGGMYAISCWLTGAEFSWKEFAIQTAIGALTGAITAATWGAAGALSPIGTGAKAAAYTTKNIVVDISLHAGAGFVAGGTTGTLQEYVRTGDLEQSLYAGLKTGAVAAVTSGVMRGIQLGEMYNNATTLSGGRYADLRKHPVPGKQDHHMPSASAAKSFLAREDGAAIRMDTADHKLTASFGSSREAIAWRKTEEDLIKYGGVKGAWAAWNMNVMDIREKFGSKYDVGIAQASEYFKSTLTAMKGY